MPRGHSSHCRPLLPVLTFLKYLPSVETVEAPLLHTRGNPRHMESSACLERRANRRSTTLPKVSSSVLQSVTLLSPKIYRKMSRMYENNIPVISLLELGTRFTYSSSAFLCDKATNWHRRWEMLPPQEGGTLCSSIAAAGLRAGRYLNNKYKRGSPSDGWLV